MIDLKGKIESLKCAMQKAIWDKGPTSSFQGWISPHGKMYPIGGREHNQFILDHPDYEHHKDDDSKAKAQAHKEGWISVGHAGFNTHEGHPKILADRNHPATTTFHRILRENSGKELEIIHNEDGKQKLHTTNTDDYLKHGENSLKKNDEVKKTVFIDGIQINIEWPKGSTRKYPDYERHMKCDYGYFAAIQGNDGEELDCYVGPNLKSKKVFQISQIHRDTAAYDEEKIMLGFDTKEQAAECYKYHISPDNMGDIREITIEDLKKRVDLLRKSDHHIELEHYSDEPNLTEIHPKFHGKGVSGRESKRKKDPEWVDRSYHYISGSKPEVDVGAKTYKYTSKVPASRIYDLGPDTEGHTCNAVDKQGFKSVNVVERRVKDAGYLGFKNSETDPNVVALFHPSVHGIRVIADDQDTAYTVPRHMAEKGNFKKPSVVQSFRQKDGVDELPISHEDMMLNSTHRWEKK